MDDVVTLKTYSEHFPKVLRTLGEPKISIFIRFFQDFYFHLQFMTGILKIISTTPIAHWDHVSVRKIRKTHHMTMPLLSTCSRDPKEHVT